MTADVLDPAAETRLRAALDAVATGDPVAPAWDLIRARVDEGPALLTPSPPSRRRVLALAAAVLVVLAVGAAVVVGTRPEHSTVTTDESTTVPAPAATGWYVPVDLPVGWVVDEVTTAGGEADICADGSEPSASDGVVWVDPGRRARISVRGSGCPPVEGDGSARPSLTPVDVDLGGGVTGEMVQLDSADGPEPMISWSDGDQVWYLEGAGVTNDELVATARSAVADGPLAIDPSGFTEADRWSAPPGPTVAVEVLVRAPSGTRALYRLEASGRGSGRGVIDPEPYVVSGQDLPVWRLWQEDVWWAMRAFGAWPGADLSVMLLVPTEPASGSDEERILDQDIDVLVAHLRPATTGQWRAFLSDVEHTPVLDEATTFTDLARLDVPPPAGPPEEDPATTTTTTG